MYVSVAEGEFYRRVEVHMYLILQLCCNNAIFSPHNNTKGAGIVLSCNL